MCNNPRNQGNTWIAQKWCPKKGDLNGSEGEIGESLFWDSRALCEPIWEGPRHSLPLWNVPPLSLAAQRNHKQWLSWMCNLFRHNPGLDLSLTSLLAPSLHHPGRRRHTKGGLFSLFFFRRWYKEGQDGIVCGGQTACARWRTEKVQISRYIPPAPPPSTYAPSPPHLLHHSCSLLQFQATHASLPPSSRLSSLQQPPPLPFLFLFFPGQFINLFYSVEFSLYSLLLNLRNLNIITLCHSSKIFWTLHCPQFKSLKLLYHLPALPSSCFSSTPQRLGFCQAAEMNEHMKPNNNYDKMKIKN